MAPWSALIPTPFMHFGRITGRIVEKDTPVKTNDPKSIEVNLYLI